MKHSKIIFILACFFAYQQSWADPIISFFFRPYPDVERFINKINKPGKIAKKKLEQIGNYTITSGILSTYGGFLQVSNSHGQTIFPRKHQAPLVYLVITNKLLPMIMFENTIHHLEFDPTAQSEIYKVEKKQDPETKLFFWNVESMELPENNIIPLESIVIIAKPKNIYVPTGITILKQDNPNLFLPDIYVKKGINIVKNALYMLRLTHIFSPLEEQYKKEKDRYIILPKD